MSQAICVRCGFQFDRNPSNRSDASVEACPSCGATGAADAAHIETARLMMERLADMLRNSSVAGYPLPVNESRDGGSSRASTTAMMEDILFNNAITASLLDAGSSKSLGVSKATLAALPIIKVDPRLRAEIVIRIVSEEGVQLVGTAASFGLCFGVNCSAESPYSLVAAKPLDCNSITLENASSCKGRIVVCLRGGISFAKKVQRCEAAGARGVIVCQNESRWPHTMTDSLGEAKELKIPSGLIKEEDGQLLLSLLSRKPSVKFIIFSRDVKACPICVEDFDAETDIMRLPCRHLYHVQCIEPWFASKATCPLCRYELPVEGSDDEHERWMAERRAEDRKAELILQRLHPDHMYG